MNLNFGKFWESVHHMADTLISRLPSLVLSIIVLVLFYVFSIFISRMIRRATRRRRQNLGMVFARLAGASTILLGLLVAVSIVAPSFQASDLIKVLGIGGVAIGFAFQNILQNFLAGLLLLWADSAYGQQRETYRVLYAVPSVAHRSEPLCKLLTPG
jgi:small-conductance mechanosensitive channel